MRRFLTPFACIFEIIILIRNFLFDNRLLNISKIKLPVISVGNITAGGTGKTPITLFLAEEAKKRGLRPAILSRGYGRVSRGYSIVHDGLKLRETVENSGDEPFLMANKLKNVPIVVSKNRLEGASIIVDRFDSDLIILDDGFQHRRLHRDVDILLINALEKSSAYHMLPAGQLRENLKNIRRANHIIITKGSIDRIPSKVQKKIKNPILSSTKYLILEHDTGKSIDLDLFKSTPIFAFCGIGDSNFFLNSLKLLKVQVVDSLIFKDHVDYDKKVLQKLYSRINKLKIDAILTTEKDLVKLPESFVKDNEIYILNMNISIPQKAVDKIFDIDFKTS